MKYILFCILLIILSCNEQVQKTTINEDVNFSAFESRFLDQYWKQYPSSAILIGYGKYYENLIVPDSISFAANVRFSKQWIDSLNALNFNSLNDNNKISFNIIKNQLESDIWYQSEFKLQQWDASAYNLSNECYYIIHQPYASLEERLRTLSKRLKNADPVLPGCLPDVESADTRKCWFVSNAKPGRTFNFRKRSDRFH